MMKYRSSDHFIQIITELRNQKKFFDATIVLDDSSRYEVHREVLAIHSEFFKALFTNENKSEYHLQCVPSYEFSQILDWIYHHQFCLNLDDCLNTLTFADYLCFDEISKVATRKLQSLVDVKNVLKISKFSDEFLLIDLSEFCLKFIHHNFVDISREKKILKLDRDSFWKIISSENLNADDAQVWDAIVEWVEYDEKGRLDFIPEFLNCIEGKKISGFPKKLAQVMTGTDHEEEVTDLIQNMKAAVTRKWPNTLLAGGGSNPTIEAFDWFANQWKTQDNEEFPVDQFNFAMAAIDQKIYWVGEDKTVCMQPRTGNLILLSPMDFERSGFAMTSYGGQLWCFGGRRGNQNLMSAEVYNPMRNQWSGLPSMNNYHTQGACANMNDCIYVAGGLYDSYDQQLSTNRVDCYSPRTKVWTGVAQMMTKRYGLALVAHDEVLYALGGATTINYSLNTCERFIKNAWECMPKMAMARLGHGAAVVNGSIIVAGGLGLKIVPLSSVEVFNIETQTWRFFQPMDSPKANLSLCFVPDVSIIWPEVGPPKVVEDSDED